MDKMTTLTAQKPDRQFYIDWLRIILILSVFLFHIGMIFNTWPWHIKNDRLFGGVLKQVMFFLHLWRMPLLFMLAGAGTYFALGKRTPGQYLSERFRRLVIPLVAGIFILVPVQVYIEKINHYDSLVAYYPHMFEGFYPVGNFSWHHLWFIAYLFVLALIISPFLNLLRGKYFRKLIVRSERILTKPLALNLFVIPLLVSQALLRPYFETGTNDLINDWASITYYLIFFISGFMLLQSPDITEAIRKYRFWHLAETIAAYLSILSVAAIVKSEDLSDTLQEVISVILAWACALTALGFARQYLNFNNQFRNIANEAIYPFYLLHQPVIVVTGYFVIHLEIEVIWKVVLVLFTSFTLTASIYWFIIRPVNFLRVIFGMKKLKKENKSVAKSPVGQTENLQDEILLSA